MNIAIFGAGAYGSALGGILKQNGHKVFFYDPFKFPSTTIEDVLASSEVNLLAVPSHLAEQLLPSIPADRPFVCATKGFLSTTPFKKYQDEGSFSVLSGGAFAAELDAKQPTTLTATSDLVRNLFENDWLKIEQTSDILGVLLCGSLKNIYAIDSGYRSLSPETAAFEDFISSALTELKSILSANDCDPATADLSCGISDLRLTCASTASRNYSFGQQLAENPALIRDLNTGTASLDTTTEGYSTAKSLIYSSLNLPPDTPILNEALKILGVKNAKA